MDLEAQVFGARYRTYGGADQVGGLAIRLGGSNEKMAIEQIYGGIPGHGYLCNL